MSSNEIRPVRSWLAAAIALAVVAVAYHATAQGGGDIGTLPAVIRKAQGNAPVMPPTSKP